MAFPSRYETAANYPPNVACANPPSKTYLGLPVDAGEVVSMIEYKGSVILATKTRAFILIDGAFRPIKFQLD